LFNAKNYFSPLSLFFFKKKKKNCISFFFLINLYRISRINHRSLASKNYKPISFQLRNEKPFSKDMKDLLLSRTYDLHWIRLSSILSPCSYSSSPASSWTTPSSPECPFYTVVAEKMGFMPTNNHLTHQLKAKNYKKFDILVK